MSTDQDPTSDPVPPRAPDEAIRLEAHAAGEARVYQAGGDQNFHYTDGAHDRRRTVSGSPVRECPYPGLAAFEPEQAQWFFGRNGLIAKLTGRLDRRLTTGGMQMVVAPSGAGKSSLLRAGLLPKLDQAALDGSDRWPKLVLTPTAKPLQALAAAIATLTGTEPGGVPEELTADPRGCISALLPSAPGQDRLVLIVDQFEELFTLCADDQQRLEFIDLLTQIAANQPDLNGAPTALVILGLRADFYPTCADYPQLRAALEDIPLVVGPMSQIELREAILFPARSVGLSIEPGLVELLLRDLGSSARTAAGNGGAYEAGRLPLLAHALRVSWQNRHGATLTVQGYHDTGGIQSAIATTADQVYNKLDDAGQRAAQRMLLRLVRIGEDTADTVRPLNHADLMRGLPAAAAESALRELTTARLVTVDRDEVDISHEALLQAWPTLAGWIEDDREWLRTRQQLASDAHEWDLRRDPSLLYQGGRLDAVRARVGDALTEQDLDQQSEQFFHASVRRARRATRIRRGIAVALTVLLVAAVVGATIAWRQSVNARHQADISTARSMIASAESIRATDPRLALQLGIAAVRLDPSRAAYASLAETLTTTEYAGALPPAAGAATAVALSPDGRTLAFGSNKRLTLWDMSHPNRPTQIGEPITSVNGNASALAWRPDGRALAVGDDAGIKLWDMTDRVHPSLPIGLAVDLTEIKTAVTDIAWADDGRFLAVGGASQVYLIEQSSNGPMRITATIGPGRRPPIALFALSPNGRLLVLNGIDPHFLAAQLWDLTDRDHPHPVGNPLEPDEFGGAEATFSPDGQVLATGTFSGGFQIWDIRVPEHPRRIHDSGPTLGLRGRIKSLQFLGDTSGLLCAADDGGIQKVWLPTDKPLAEQRTTESGFGGYFSTTKPMTGHRGSISTMSYSRQRALLASSSGDGATLFWDLASQKERPSYTGKWLDTKDGGPSGVNGQLSAGGSLLSTFYTAGGKALIWDIAHPTNAAPRRPVSYWPPGKKADKSMERVPLMSILSPNGRWLATGGQDLEVQLWDPSGGSGEGRTISHYEKAFVTAIAWSGDSRILAVGYDDGMVVLHTIDDSGGTRLVGSIKHPIPVFNVLTSRTGNRLVLIDGDGTAVIWDTTNPANPGRLGEFPIGQIGNLRWSTALSADGRTFAIGHESAEVTLWNLANPNNPSQLASIRLDSEPPVYAVAFSTDGDVLATGSQGAIQLWDLYDRVQPRRIGTDLFTGVDLRSLIFLPDDRTLVSQSSFRLSLWDVSMIANVRRDADKIACDRLAGQALDIQTWNQYAPGSTFRNTC